MMASELSTSAARHAALDEVRARPPTPRPPRCSPSPLQAERLLVSRSFAKAADEASAVLAAELLSQPQEAGAESLCDAAAAVLVQARRMDGSSPQETRDSLVKLFRSLRSVPPETLALW